MPGLHRNDAFATLVAGVATGTLYSGVFLIFGVEVYLQVRTDNNLDSIGTDDPKAMQLYVVSSNTFQAQLLKTCLDSELGLPCFHHRSLSLNELVEKSKDHGCIYLLDCLKLNFDGIEKQLQFGISAVPENILIALYNVDAGINLVSIVKRYKIRGIFFHEDSQSVFIRGMKLIINGELWLSRKLLSKCILTPDKATKKPSLQELPQLSRREIEILRHVGDGQSNQEIAVIFDISPYTVKTHIYNIYKKINASNRLQATQWAITYLR